jgi:hypothetical protein
MDPATILAISQLLAQLIPAGINLYTQLEQNSAGANVTPLATILANADADWNAIAALAAAQQTAASPAAPAA